MANDAAAPQRNLASTSALIAKAAFQRLATARLEPTPENYARAWMEAGGPPADAVPPPAARPLFEALLARALGDERALQAELLGLLTQGRWSIAARRFAAMASPGESESTWATLIEQVVRGVERGSRQWTTARKKESLKHVLDGSRGDAARLRERLGHLVASWERGSDGDAGEAADSASPPTGLTVPGALAESAAATTAWPALGGELMQSLGAGLPADERVARELALGLAGLSQRLVREGAEPSLVREISAACADARELFTRRHHLVGELTRLVRELTEGLTDLAENESWAQGQAMALREHLGDADTAPSVRGVRAAGALLTQTRRQQQSLKAERDRAREALRVLVASLMSELAQLGGHTGQFGDDLARYTDTLESGTPPEDLASLVHDMLAKARAVQAEVNDAGTRLAAGQAEALNLTSRVLELESELRRLADEVSTDALTQVANRRGLQQAFDQERARAERDGSALAVALIDIDNFKRLNDSLGHAVGDEALKALAAQTRAALRPVDHLARFGGEEFVVLLPATDLTEGAETLTRLQRQLSMSLFMHEGKEVFVTFSAGVTVWRAGEGLDETIERADGALYVAKRSGKNRTCSA